MARFLRFLNATPVTADSGRTHRVYIMISVLAEGTPADFPTGTGTGTHDGHVTEIAKTKILCSLSVRHNR